MGGEFGWLIVFFGLLMFGFGGYMYRLGMISVSWPSVVGKITEAEVVRAGTSAGSNSWQPAITYVYDVNGVELKGNRIRITDKSYPLPKLAEKVLLEYPIESEVTVFYNPDKPTTCVLIPGITSGVYGIFVGALAVVIGGFFVINKF